MAQPVPTLAQFEQYVATGEIHSLIASGSGNGGGGSGSGGRDGTGGNSGTYSAILTWVSAHYTASTVGAATVYDLTAAKT